MAFVDQFENRLQSSSLRAGASRGCKQEIEERRELSRRLILKARWKQPENTTELNLTPSVMNIPSFLRDLTPNKTNVEDKIFRWTGNFRFESATIDRETIECGTEISLRKIYVWTQKGWNPLLTAFSDLLYSTLPNVRGAIFLLALVLFRFLLDGLRGKWDC